MWQWWHCGFLCSFVGFVCYLNAFSAGLVYDDSRAVEKNSDLLPTTPWKDIFLHDFWGTPLTHSGSHKSYRPLCVASFRLNYLFDELNPVGYHVINVILHAVACWLVVLLAHTLLSNDRVSVFTGLMFATHPIHTEAVTGVVGRADVGACVFFLMSFLTYTRSCQHGNRTDWRWFILSLVLSAASMLTKEQGITVLGVCVLYDLMIVSKVLQNLKNLGLLKTVQKFFTDLWMVRPLITVLFALGLLSLRFIAMGNSPPSFSPSDNPAANSDNLITRIRTFLYLPLFNLWLLLCPSTLSFDWSMDAVPMIDSWEDHRNIFIGLFYTVLVLFCGSTIQNILISSERSCNNLTQNGSTKNGTTKNGTTKNGSSSKHTHSTNNHSHVHQSKTKHSQRTLNHSKQNSEPLLVHLKNTSNFTLVALCILVLPFIPASNAFFYVGFVVAERVLYIPSIGFCLLVALGIELLWQRCHSDRTLQTLVATMFISLILLFSWRTVIRNQDWKDEESLYRSGIPTNPAKAYGNLGNVLNTQGRVKEAEEAFVKALQHRGNMADTHYNLGILLFEQGRIDEAIKSYRNAIVFRPRLAVAHLNLAISLEKKGNKIEALKVLREASTLSDNNLKDPKQHAHAICSIKYNIGKILLALEKPQDALVILKDAVDTRPSHFAPHSLFNLLGEAFFALDQFKDAETWYLASLSSKPDHVPVHLTYAKFMSKMGKITEAEDMFLKAQNLEPSNSAIYTHYAQFLSEQGNFKKAAEMFTMAKQLSPTSYDIVFNTGNLQRQAGDFVEAEKSYREALLLDQTNPGVYMNLGALLHLNGKLDEAETMYLQALALAPDDKLTKENLGKLRNLKAKRGKGGEKRKKER